MGAEEQSVAGGELLDVLYVGQCESLKAGVHGLLMLTVGLCALYNAAAWVRRRESHLGINALLYGAGTLWEYQHVQQHLACRRTSPAIDDEDDPLRDAA